MTQYHRWPTTASRSNRLESDLHRVDGVCVAVYLGCRFVTNSSAIRYRPMNTLAMSIDYSHVLNRVTLLIHLVDRLDFEVFIENGSDERLAVVERVHMPDDSWQPYSFMTIALSSDFRIMLALKSISSLGRRPSDISYIVYRATTYLV